MDSILSTSRNVAAPEPRPMVPSPSTAAREPDQDKPARRLDHSRNHGKHHERGRSHVQQGMRHIIRDIRHAIRDEVKAGVKSGEIDLETMGSIRDLQRSFRRDLQGMFLDAGQKGGVDRNQVLEGMIEALQSLAAGLREITGNEPEPAKLDPEIPVVSSEPGSLLDLTV